MVKLEDVITVPDAYDEIAVLNESIVGQKIHFRFDEFHLQLLQKDGSLQREFGRDYFLRCPKYLFRDLNPLQGTAEPLELLGGSLSFPVQALYNLATLPLQKRYHRQLPKTADHLVLPIAMAATEEKIFVLDVAQQWFQTLRGYENKSAVNLALFDTAGEALGKVLEAGSAEGEIFANDLYLEMRMGVFGESIVILDDKPRLQQFDTEGNFQRVLCEDVPFTCDSYNGFSVGAPGMYLGVERGEPRRSIWSNGVIHIDWDGRMTEHDLRKDVRDIAGLACSNDAVYVLDGNGFGGVCLLTYDLSMQLKAREEIPVSIGYNPNRKLVWHDGNLYCPGYSNQDKKHVILKFSD